jgi:septal ring factor EnvC (AmiA/AmiB activator)
MRRGNKIRTAAVGILCLTTMTTAACVTRSTYDSATVDLRATKAELYSSRTEMQGLTQQVNVFQERQGDLERQKEIASSALRQVKKEMKTERAASQKRLSTLNRSIQQLTAQQKSLRHAIKRATNDQITLQSTVDNYTSQLRSIEELHASTTPQLAATTSEPVKTTAVPPAQTVVSDESAPKPTVVTTSAPVNQPVATPKPRAPVQPPQPVEEDWLSFFKNWISSLWESAVFF